MQMARISAMASLGMKTSQSEAVELLLKSAAAVAAAAAAAGLPVAVHKDPLEDGVHHVLNLILVFLEL